ncbi:MAG: class I SAM-dependent methyltransferase [Desulfarculaceae bacterium]|nr:class I SAM-dependent methyltransferase [Desulfarculaceae bacterium]MCF8074336.1 class I SAM-dependent methyltransferase [Desulfarculaceae bacterium]MCF8103564.1 class I SAM-dependent methyltransferase [Desulfarculaceae bacterium]MCF8117331.1 class I SAM-dependent methyltransferase [Desulfarculaceae bacterium]
MEKQHVCPWWLAYTFDNPLRRLAHDPAKMFGEYVGRGSRAADIGCGMGFFSLGLARLVGDEGKVYSLDLQEKMLSRVRGRAERAGLGGRIETRQVTADNLGGEDLSGGLDLVLAFWMLHEVPDQAGFMAQVKHLLKPGGVFFLAEPRMHVSQEAFAASLKLTQEAGYDLAAQPKVSMSRAAVLKG